MRVFAVIGFITALVAPMIANAMHCKACTDSQCAYLAEKYSNGDYQMKGVGYHYTVLANEEAQNEALKARETIIQAGQAEKADAQVTARQEEAIPRKTEAGLKLEGVKGEPTHSSIEIEIDEPAKEPAEEQDPSLDESRLSVIPAG